MNRKKNINTRSMIKDLRSNNIYIVIPGYNEEKYISIVLKKAKKFSKNIIFVDDGSGDNTVELAKKEIKHVLVHKVNLGKGSALKTGCDFAFNYLNADAVVVMDADDQHDPQELPEFIDALENGAEVVLGTRAVDEHMPAVRRHGNKFLSSLVKLLFGVYIPDILSGYKGFTKNAYRSLSWNCQQYGVEAELAIRIAKFKLPFKIVRIKTIYHDFDRGMTMLDSLEIIVQIISWRLFL